MPKLYCSSLMFMCKIVATILMHNLCIMTGNFLGTTLGASGQVDSQLKQDNKMYIYLNYCVL